MFHIWDEAEMNRIPEEEYCEAHYPFGKADLATCFVARCNEFCNEGGTAATLVSPQSWLYISPYRGWEKLLRGFDWNLLGQLGPRAFEKGYGRNRKRLLDGHRITGLRPDPLCAVDVSSKEATPQRQIGRSKGTLGPGGWLSAQTTINPDFRNLFGEAVEVTTTE